MNYVTEYNDIPETIQKSLDKANIYYSREFFESEKNSGLIYFFDENRILVCTRHKKYIFHSLGLPTEPFVWQTEGVLEEKFFLDAFVECCKKIKNIDWIGPTAVTALFMDAPTGSINIPFGSHIIDLSQSEEEIWSSFHRKHRSKIRKAEEEGVVVKMGGINLLVDYELIDKDTWDRSNIKVDFDSVYKKLLQDYSDNCYIFMAYYEDEPQGGAIFLANKEMSYYLYGASKNNPLTGSVNYLHWNAIKYFKEKSIKKYSFVGCRINEDVDSKYHGIQRFKEGFGGELIIGRMFKYVIHNRKYQLFLKLKQIKSKGKSKDIIDQELHKWKDIQ